MKKKNFIEIINDDKSHQKTTKILEAELCRGGKRLYLYRKAGWRGKGIGRGVHGHGQFLRGVHRVRGGRGGRGWEHEKEEEESKQDAVGFENICKYLDTQMSLEKYKNVYKEHGQDWKGDTTNLRKSERITDLDCDQEKEGNFKLLQEKGRKDEVEARAKKEQEEKERKERQEREKKDREEREISEREERGKKEREEKEKQEREEKEKKEREEKEKKEREEKEKKEREEREKKEREKQIEEQKREKKRKGRKTTQGPGNKKKILDKVKHWNKKSKGKDLRINIKKIY